MRSRTSVQSKLRNSCSTNTGATVAHGGVTRDALSASTAVSSRDSIPEGHTRTAISRSAVSTVTAAQAFTLLTKSSVHSVRTRGCRIKDPHQEMALGAREIQSEKMENHYDAISVAVISTCKPSAPEVAVEDKWPHGPIHYLYKQLLYHHHLRHHRHYKIRHRYPSLRLQIWYSRTQAQDLARQRSRRRQNMRHQDSEGR